MKFDFCLMDRRAKESRSDEWFCCEVMAPVPKFTREGPPPSCRRGERPHGTNVRLIKNFRGVAVIVPFRRLPPLEGVTLALHCGRAECDASRTVRCEVGSPSRRPRQVKLRTGGRLSACTLHVHGSREAAFFLLCIACPQCGSGTS